MGPDWCSRITRRPLATEFADRSITVNSICPGYFPTKMTQSALEFGEKRIPEDTPMRRLGNDTDFFPEDQEKDHSTSSTPSRPLRLCCYFIKYQREIL
ncbi:SDR family oxidoreductase [Deinococcus cavernae]|uniref:SDR family oxidoreductase n=1 Tax=Deinococcus cavernae TaxID=2320857 RepID=A0A418V057_9DEIO|nr:SDR family oxidoreductase [Deinococcus cavernae]RJF69109.1 SDR family oxidoreductase [Deinococcus cavernae]